MNGIDASNSPAASAVQDRRVFAVDRCAPDASLEEDDKGNDVASNFEELSAAERYMHFQRQAYIIKQLKRKLRAEERLEDEATRRLLVKADGVVRKAKVELKDQQELVGNLVTAISEKKLKVGSLPFERICTIVRSLREDGKEGKVVFSEKEQTEYGSLLKADSVSKILRGKPVEREVTRDDVMDLYVLMQSDFLRKMPSDEFFDMLRVQREIQGNEC